MTSYGRACPTRQPLPHSASRAQPPWVRCGPLAHCLTTTAGSRPQGPRSCRGFHCSTPIYQTPATGGGGGRCEAPLTVSCNLENKSCFLLKFFSLKNLRGLGWAAVSLRFCSLGRVRERNHSGFWSLPWERELSDKAISGFKAELRAHILGSRFSGLPETEAERVPGIHPPAELWVVMS